MGSSKFINQEMERYYLLNVDQNGMTAHFSRSAYEGF